MKRRRHLTGGVLLRNYTIRERSVIDRFHACNAPIRFLVGPWRSGKSVACVMELVRRAMQQAPGPDGIRHSKWAIVRNHHTELKTTTIPTFIQWFPPGQYGELKLDLPATYLMRFGDVEAEFTFMALNREEDLAKLQSFECTGAWINEGRFVPRAIMDDLLGRTGQYPDKQMGGATWHGVIVDTNPCDEDGWIATLEDQVEGWREARLKGLPPPQPDEDAAAAFLPAQAPNDNDPITKAVSFNPDLYEFFHQPSGLSDEAENTENLVPGYYRELASAHSHDAEWLRVYIHGLYGGVESSRTVYPRFAEYKEIGGIRAPWNVSKDFLEPLPGLPLFLGTDFGLTPAICVSQYLPNGQLRVLQEIIGVNINVRDFIRTSARWWLNTKYQGYKIVSTGDPSGGFRRDTTGETCLDIMRQENIPTDAAETNDPLLRIDAVDRFLMMNCGSEPGLLIDPRCRVLIQGFKKGYRWKRGKRQGEERVFWEVDKDGNPFCVDMSAEAMTPAGWKRAHELQEGDPIFAWDVEKKELALSSVRGVHVFSGPQRAIRIFGNETEIISTPNHRHIVHTKCDVWRIVETKDLKQGHRFVTPLAFPDDAEKEGLNDDFVRLAAWVAAEGHFVKFEGRNRRGNKAVGLCQSQKANPKYVTFLKGLLAKFSTVGMCAAPSEKNHWMMKWRLRGDVAEQLRMAMPNKIPSSEFIAAMNNRQRRSFLYEFIRADGCFTNGTGRVAAPDVEHVTAGSFHFAGKQTVRVAQAKKEMIDALQMIAILGGVNANYRVRKHKDGVLHSLTITKTRNRTDLQYLKREQVVVDGVWCPTTDHGTWIMRSRGRVYATGNTHVHDALQYAILGIDLSSRRAKLNSALGQNMKQRNAPIYS